MAARYFKAISYLSVLDIPWVLLASGIKQFIIKLRLFPYLMTVACIIRDLQHAVSEVGGQDAVPEYGRGHERLQPSLPSGAPRY
jgi:hypothetical protein